ncbi:MAG: hypothetical protein ABSF90_20135 [Syntrophobacteraceae bacterium]|jgi:hypothetical protein
MKLLLLLVSLTALVVAFAAYERTRALEGLLPLARVLSDAQNAGETVKKKTAAAREKVAEALENLAECIRK